MGYNYIGTITNVRGYEGEMRITDLQVDLISINVGTTVKVGYSLNFSRDFTLTKWRQTRKSAKIEIKGVKSDKAALEFLEHGIFVDEKDISYKNQGKNNHEWINFDIYDINTGALLGKIVEIWKLPANDVFLMDTGEAIIPVPIIKDVVKKINYKLKLLRIEMIDGLTEIAL